MSKPEHKYNKQTRSHGVMTLGNGSSVKILSLSTLPKDTATELAGLSPH